eukprot:3942964-Amphidinium_carterae.1
MKYNAISLQSSSTPHDSSASKAVPGAGWLVGIADANRVPACAKVYVHASHGGNALNANLVASTFLVRHRLPRRLVRSQESS